ncbi:ran-binding protein 3 [Chelonus insularis]|uniref:ran-binding protein 3 n=1 Tax=Chelonus insularis TaxID=460826 RepID=UPI00158BF301|nr:ran-binding protein 3 [Chelonus insularis]
MADYKENTEEKNGPRPTIVMKVDAPEESSENSANDEADGQSAEENSQTPSSPSSKFATKIHHPVLMQSKFGDSFGISEFSKSSESSGLKSSILRPSQLSALTNSAGPAPKSKTETNSLQQNPFTKVSDKAIFEDEEEDSTTKNNDKKDTKTNSESNSNNTDKKNKEDTKITPTFIPLGSTPKENDTNVNNIVTANCSTPGFVFGQNIKDRVTGAKDSDDSSEEKKEEEESKKEESSTENGSSELLFSNAAAVCRTASRPGLTLTQAAQEIEEANRANKRKYNQITPLTGEEGETNILQINCKLFTFDKETSSWKERGRGTLRLNDRDDESRLVGRVTGTQRLILNTKIWSGMTVERAGPKSLRLTAMDVHGDIRIFIVQAAPSEVDQLHNFLMQRIKRAEERQPKKTCY